VKRARSGLWLDRVRHQAQPIDRYEPSQGIADDHRPEITVVPGDINLGPWKAISDEITYHPQRGS